MRLDSELGRSIATSIGLERRPPVLIGGDVDYTEVTRGVRAMLIGVIAVIAMLVLLSLVVTVEEVARARGEFTPVRRVQVIQSQEGGAVAAVMAQNGDLVRKGQPIVRFRATDLLRDIQQADVRAAYFAINIERLDAFAAGRAPNFAPFRAKYPQLVQEASSLHEEKSRELARTIDQKNREIDEERTGLMAAQSEIAAARSSSDAAAEVLERMRDGARRGIVARNRLAQVEEQAAEARRTYTQLAAAPQERAARIRRLEAEREAIKARAAADARTERADLLARRDELSATQAAYRSRSDDILVKAPVSGVIQKISETQVGTVIPPGGTVSEIVPIEGGVLMRARVSPSDIGFVRLGQDVVVKSDAFDSSRFGTVSGKVVRIAASNTQDGLGQAPYILVEIALDQPFVGNDKAHVLTPGMTGEATILTGQKTIFQYLLKPIYATMDTAFREH